MSDNSDYVIGARIDKAVEADDTFDKQDPFNKSWDDLKNLNGLDNNFKRRTSRVTKSLDSDLSKVDASQGYIDSARAVSSGINGAQSKEINPGLVYAIIAPGA